MSKKPYKPRRVSRANAAHKIENYDFSTDTQKITKNSAEKVSSDMVRIYLLAAYFLISLVIIFFAYCEYDSYIKRKRVEMEASGHEIETNFSNTIGYAESVLSHINRQIIATNQTSYEIANILSSYNRAQYGYSSIKDMLSAGMFYWIDANKMLIASSSGTIASPIDLSSRDYLAQTEQDPWRIYTGSAIVGASSGQYVIPAGVGLENDKEQYLGTAVVSFKINNLLENFKRLTSFYKTDFAILDNNNKILIESSPGIISENIDLLENLKGNSAAMHYETVSDFSFFQPRENFTIIKSFEKFPYKILVSYENAFLVRGVFAEILPQIIELIMVSFFFVVMFKLLNTAVKRHVRF